MWGSCIRAGSWWSGRSPSCRAASPRSRWCSRRECRPLPREFEILHMSNTGRVYTLIVKGDPQKAKEMLKAARPMLIDVLPLTLEEIFIYEMGGVNYEIKDILF